MEPQSRIGKNIVDAITHVETAFFRMRDDIMQKRVRGIFLLVLAAILLSTVQLTVAANWLIFLTFVLYSWENRIVAGAALLFLMACPILLAMHRDALAEAVAVQAYFFLVMTVILQIVELRKQPPDSMMKHTSGNDRSEKKSAVKSKLLAIRISKKSMVNIFPYLFFSGVALLLLFPTLAPGYVFALDWTVSPFYSLSDINLATDGLGRILIGLGYVIFSFGAFQRIVLFSIVIGLGMAGMRLGRRIGGWYAGYFAGMLLIFNPFIYARLLEQVGIALGCMLLLWCVVLLGESLEKKSNRALWGAAVFAGLAVSIFPHAAVFVAFACGIFWLNEYVRSRDIRIVAKQMAVVAAVVIACNGNWMAGYLIGAGDGVGGIHNFSSVDWQVFRTREIGGDDIYRTVLGLQGYWGEFQDRFVSIRENPLWRSGCFALGALVALGAYTAFRRRDRYAVAVAFLGVGAFVLAMGVASNLFAPITTTLYEHTDIYKGLREPQKWVVLLLFAYTYFGAWGVRTLMELKKVQAFRREVGFVAVLVPLLFSFSMVGGMHAYVQPHEFPASWYAAREKILATPHARVLLFPWHLYPYLDFADKEVAVPGKSFFGKEVIQANNIEFGELYSHANDPQTLLIERYAAIGGGMENSQKQTDFAGDMKTIGVDMVIVLKIEDWKQYRWLEKTMGVEKILENEDVAVFRVR